MKSWAKIALCTLLALGLPLALCAEPVSQLRPTGYVNDFAHVLDQSTVAQLTSICEQIDQKAHAQIAVVTINSLDGSDIDSYAVSLFKKWGIGSKATDHGVLILLAVQDRKYRIEVGYGLEPILPDGKVGGFGREAVPFLKQNDYGSALLLMTGRVADVIAQDAGVTISAARPPVPAVTPDAPRRGVSLGTIVFFIIVGMVLLFTRFGRMLLWMFLLGGRGGGGYGGGGGGFGGGGGGFGGFGGGGSGGGGASGGW